MDDILKRLGNVEISVSELKSQVSSILGVIPHLATKADVAELRTSVGADVAAVRTSVRSIEALIPQLATKADVAVIPTLATKVDVASLKAAIIKWIIATTLATASLAFAIAKFVH